MTLEGGTSQACAACKYQRRKCTPECPLAPYFHTDQPKMFQNAHRLFGVSNICKMLERLPDASLKNEAMASIIYEADVWDKYPINGCMEIINQLQVQIYCCVEQLHVINSMLAAYRHQTQQQQMLPLDSDAQLQLGMMAFPANDNMPVVYHHPCIGDDGLNSVSLNHSCSRSNNVDNKEKDNICNDVLYIGQDYNQQLPSTTTLGMRCRWSRTYSPRKHVIQQDSFRDYGEMQQFFDLIDDRQSYIEPK